LGLGALPLVLGPLHSEGVAVGPVNFSRQCLAKVYLTRFPYSSGVV
jgi:hypothetical protein